MQHTNANRDCRRLHFVRGWIDAAMLRPTLTSPEVRGRTIRMVQEQTRLLMSLERALYDREMDGQLVHHSDRGSYYHRFATPTACWRPASRRQLTVGRMRTKMLVPRGLTASIWLPSPGGVEGDGGRRVSDARVGGLVQFRTADGTAEPPSARRVQGAASPCLGRPSNLG